MALTLETIIDKFKAQLETGDKLKEIVPVNEKIGQVRIEDGNFTIQLRWEVKNNNEENRLLSFKPNRNDKWNVYPIDKINNGDKDKVNSVFTEIKNKLLHKNIIKEEVIKNGLQRNEENNKENKEIDIKEIDVINTILNVSSNTNTNINTNNVITEIDDIKVESDNSNIKKVELSTIDTLMKGEKVEIKPVIKKAGRPKKAVK